MSVVAWYSLQPDGDLKLIEDLEATAADHDAVREEFLKSFAGKTIVTTLSTDMGKQIIDALTSVGMSQDEVTFVDEQQDALLAFIDVMHRIIRYCDAETDACGQTITDRLNQETAAGLTVDGFKEYWQNIELYAGNAQDAQDMILSEDGVAYWQTTWDSDNTYLVGSGGIPAEVSADDHFLMPQVLEAYVAKCGADQTG